jgi:hypothetical protein
LDVYANGHTVRIILSVAPSKMQDSAAARSIGRRRRRDKEKFR